MSYVRSHLFSYEDGMVMIEPYFHLLGAQDCPEQTAILESFRWQAGPHTKRKDAATLARAVTLYWRGKTYKEWCDLSQADVLGTIESAEAVADTTKPIED